MRGNSCGYKDAKAVRKFAYSNTLVTKWSEGQARQPAGGPTGGQFAPKGGGSGGPDKKPEPPQKLGRKDGTFFSDLKNKVKNNPVEHTAPHKGTPGAKAKDAKAQIKGLRAGIVARNASKYDRMNSSPGADPAAINSAIRNSNAKDRAKIKRLQQGLD